MVTCTVFIFIHTIINFILSGGWSTDGITAQLIDSNTIQCTTTHLTSFSVLVGPSGSETTSVSTFSNTEH